MIEFLENHSQYVVGVETKHIKCTLDADEFELNDDELIIGTEGRKISVRPMDAFYINVDDDNDEMVIRNNEILLTVIGL